MAHSSGTRREHGFTLVELVVGLVIVAILMAIAVPSYMRQKTVAHQKAMIGATELIAAGVALTNAEFPPINGTDQLISPSATLRQQVCRAGNPVCRPTDQSLYSRSGMPAVKEWPESPYGGPVRLERSRACGSGSIGTVWICRVAGAAPDAYRVMAWGRSHSGVRALVYDKTYN